MYPKYDWKNIEYVKEKLKIVKKDRKEEEIRVKKLREKKERARKREEGKSEKGEEGKSEKERQIDKSFERGEYRSQEEEEV